MPHSLDVMHITKNVCESLLGTLLNMPERTKDGPKARVDLKSMGIREELHANDDDDDEAKQDTEIRGKGKKAKKTGNEYPPACLTLSQEEIEQFFHLPRRSKTSLWLRGEDQQIPRPSEAEVQRDQVS